MVNHPYSDSFRFYDHASTHPFLWRSPAVWPRECGLVFFSSLPVPTSGPSFDQRCTHLQKHEPKSQKVYTFRVHRSYFAFAVKRQTKCSTDLSTFWQQPVSHPVPLESSWQRPWQPVRRPLFQWSSRFLKSPSVFPTIEFREKELDIQLRSHRLWCQPFGQRIS